MRYLLFLTLLISQISYAEEWHLLELNEASFEGYKIINNRDSYWPYADPYSNPNDAEHWTTGAALNWDVSLVKYDIWDLYWDNRIHMASTEQQVRQVGWQWEAGVHAGEKIDIFWFHHSQHLLDESSDAGYPLENYVGARLNLYKRK